MKSYLCEDAESVMELSFSCSSYVWNCARHLKHSLVANVVRWDWSMFSYYNPPLLERHCTLGCWDLSPCGVSRLLCRRRCSTSTFHNHTWIYPLWVIFNNVDFLSHHANFLSKKRSVKYIWTPRSRKFANSPWKQTAEYVQRVSAWANLDHVQSRRLDKKYFSSNQWKEGVIDIFLYGMQSNDLHVTK